MAEASTVHKVLFGTVAWNSYLAEELRRLWVKISSSLKRALLSTWRWERGSKELTRRDLADERFCLGMLLRRLGFHLTSTRCIASTPVAVVLLSPASLFTLPSVDSPESHIHPPTRVVCLLKKSRAPHFLPPPRQPVAGVHSRFHLRLFSLTTTLALPQFHASSLHLLLPSAFTPTNTESFTTIRNQQEFIVAVCLNPSRLFFFCHTTPTLHARAKKRKKAKDLVCDSCVNILPFRNNAYPERFSNCRDCCNRCRELSAFSTTHCMSRGCFEYAHDHDYFYYYRRLCRLASARPRTPPARHSCCFTMSVGGFRTRCCFPGISALNR
ncbi:hypothetical protein BDD12DRAFT_426823 [Trichophaea hybrida]|nr:hypothetical protein BDD12DRAFT_426823 [Trichophaea hybrida]